jgi:hypothetical protein
LKWKTGLIQQMVYSQGSIRERKCQHASYIMQEDIFGAIYFCLRLKCHYMFPSLHEVMIQSSFKLGNFTAVKLTKRHFTTWPQLLVICLHVDAMFFFLSTDCENLNWAFGRRYCQCHVWTLNFFVRDDFTYRAAKLPLKKELIPITITCFKM